MSFGVKVMSASGAVLLDTSTATLRLHSVWTIPSLTPNQLYRVDIAGFSVASGWRILPEGQISLYAQILTYDGYITVQNKHSSTITASTLLVLKS